MESFYETGDSLDTAPKFIFSWIGKCFCSSVIKEKKNLSCFWKQFHFQNTISTSSFFVQSSHHFFQCCYIPKKLLPWLSWNMLFNLMWRMRLKVARIMHCFGKRKIKRFSRTRQLSETKVSKQERCFIWLGFSLTICMSRRVKIRISLWMFRFEKFDYGYWIFDLDWYWRNGAENGN